MGADEWVGILLGDPDLKKYLKRNLEHFTERFERHLGRYQTIENACGQG
jgi:hypothetical protein